MAPPPGPIPDFVSPNWQGFLEHVPYPTFLHDDAFRLLAANQAYLAWAELSWPQAAGRPYFEVFPVRDEPLLGCRETLHDARVRTDKVTVAGVDWINFSFRLNGEGGETIRSGHILIPHDTFDHLREEEVARYQRALRVIWRSNRILLKSRTEAALYQEVSDVIVEEVGYDLTWIGMLDRDPSAGLAVVAHAGRDDGYLADLDLEGLTAGTSPHPARDTLRTGCSQVLQEIPDNPDADDWVHEAFAHGFRAAFVTPLKVQGEVRGVLSIYAREGQAFSPLEKAVLEELASDLGFGVSTIRTRAELERNRERVEQALEATIHSVARVVEERDPYTAGHQERVADLAVAIARDLGFDADTIRGIRLGAWVHDIGKVKVPADILNKPGKLSEAEFAVVQEHVAAGVRILEGAEFPWPILDMIRQHHERLDGSGYPHGLRDGAIIPEARILAVADVVEAVSSHRPYRPALGSDKAKAILRQERSSRLDTEAVDACLRLLEAGRFAWE
ncbi:MAG TPA: HD domain-containing phosphohydrolase [Gammaproteobacteria bacterium]|nr:HD domain-containing phosphohydrolase [Gammaproteobacteria bacterium]